MPQTEIRLFRTARGEVPLSEWLNDLQATSPGAFRRCLAAIVALSRSGFELRRPLADYLRDGIRELRVKQGRVHYRLLYSFDGKNIAVLTHGITKKGRVPPVEIERAIECLNLVRADREKHTAVFEF
jgi:hypothetical protein